MASQRYPRRLQPGQLLKGIPAGSWNAFCDAWERTLETPPRVDEVTRRAGGQPEATTVEVLNITGFDLIGHAPIVKIAGFSRNFLAGTSAKDDWFTLFEKKTFIAEEPSEDGVDFAVCQGPIVNGYHGTAAIEGVVWAKVDVVDEDLATRAQAIANETKKLRGGNFGVPILWKESGVGEKWALIHLGPQDQMGVISGECVNDVTGDDFFEIQLIDLEWGRLPPGVESGSTAPEGRWLVRNQWNQDFAAGDLVTAFETIKRRPITEAERGLSTMDAVAEEGTDAVAESGTTAVGTDTGGEAEWWAFSPVAGTSTGAIMITKSLIPVATRTGPQLEPGRGLAKILVEVVPGSFIWEEQGDDLDVFNPFTQGSVQDDTVITCKKVAGRWIIDAEDCPP